MSRGDFDSACADHRDETNFLAKIGLVYAEALVLELVGVVGAVVIAQPMVSAMVTALTPREVVVVMVL